MGRTDMLKPGDVLRLSEGGTLTRKEISLGTGTVSNILARAAAVGVSWPLPDGVAIADLRRASLSAVRDGQRGLPGAGAGGCGAGADGSEDQAGISGAARDAGSTVGRVLR